MATLGSLILYSGTPGRYGKHSQSASSGVSLLPARIAWFLQELPSFVVSVGMLVWQPRSLFGQPGNVLLGLFSAHYFHRLAFFSAERSARLGSTSRGSMLNGEKLGVRQTLSARRAPSFRLNFPELGLLRPVRSSLHCPLNALQILQTVWQCWRGSGSGQSGLGKLGSPGWKGAIGQGASLSSHSPCQGPAQSGDLTFLL